MIMMITAAKTAKPHLTPPSTGRGDTSSVIGSLRFVGIMGMHYIGFLVAISVIVSDASVLSYVLAPVLDPSERLD